MKMIFSIDLRRNWLPIVVLLAAAAPARAARFATRNGSAMGTEVRISVYTDDEPGALRAADAAFAEIRRIEALMTTWRDDSEVSRVNAQAGVQPVRVSDELLEVLDMAEKAARWSDGAFDVTFYALKGLWRFDEDLERRVPDEAELKRRLPLIDHKALVIDRAAHTVFLRKKGMAINLGGIAKGYAVDRAAAVLRKAGFKDAIVQAGGDLMCAGSKEGQPFVAGIRDPRGGRADVFGRLKLIDHAFSTAGDYERFFILDGKRYHHILDPRTGHPATRSRSVTIYAPNALLADALDDAVFILGWERGFQMLSNIPDVGAVVVDDHGQVHVSPRIVDRVQIDYTPANEP
jgi:thiamine biosynthesis lipoprotein